MNHFVAMWLFIVGLLALVAPFAVLATWIIGWGTARSNAASAAAVAVVLVVVVPAAVLVVGPLVNGWLAPTLGVSR